MLLCQLISTHRLSVLPIKLKPSITINIGKRKVFKKSFFKAHISISHCHAGPQIGTYSEYIRTLTKETYLDNHETPTRVVSDINIAIVRKGNI